MENINFKIIRLDEKKLQQNETRKQTSKAAILRISLVLLL